MECNGCKTEYGYFRMESREWVCRKCGHITPTNPGEGYNHDDNKKRL